MINVSVLAYCRDEELLYGTLLLFKTIRVGFPNADVTIYDNANPVAIASRIAEEAGKTECGYVILDEELPHDVWLRRVCMDGSLRGQHVVLDPDVMFWQNVEGWRWADRVLMAGHRTPETLDNQITNSTILSRLHSSFLWFPHPEKFWMAVDAIESASYVGGFGKRNLFSHKRCYVRGESVTVDTASDLAWALSSRTADFTDAQLDCYDHLIGGSGGYFQKGEEPLQHKLAKTGRYGHLKGMWKRQEQFLMAMR